MAAIQDAENDLKLGPTGDQEIDRTAQLVQLGESVAYDHAETKRLKRKVDLRILPIICITYALQGVDKTTLGYAAVWGMREDLNFTGSQYSWAASIFYFGYLISQFPTNIILQKVPINRFMSATVIIWGATLMCHAAATNFAGILVARFFLGAFEASINPGTMLLYSMYYLRHEQQIGMGYMVGASGGGYILSGIASYGLGHVDSGIASWRLLFLFWGALTILWGIVQLVWLPGSPLSAKFLTEAEKSKIILRVQQNGTGVENKHFKWEQFREALLEPKTWLLFFLNMCINSPNGGLQAFQGLIIEGLGFSKLQTSLIQMPSGAVQLISCPLACWIIYRCHNARLLTMAISLIPFLAGTIGVWTTPNSKPYGRLASLWLTFTYNAAWTLSLAVATANTAGQTKKIATNAIMLIGYSIGNIIGPLFFQDDQAPRYPLGIGMMLFCSGIQYSCLAGLFLTMWLRNRSRKDLHAQDGRSIGFSEANERGMQDQTDKENRYFKVWLSRNDYRI